VTAVNPAARSAGVPTSVGIWLRFNEPIQTLIAEQFVIAFGGIPALVQLTDVSDGNRLVQVHPNLPLNPSAVYTLTLIGSEDPCRFKGRVPR
jgi:hypothetical protein